MRKDLLTFSTVDIRIITVGRVEGQILFKKENWTFREKRKNLLIFSHKCKTIVLGKCTLLSQQGNFPEHLRNRSVFSPKPNILFCFPLYGAVRSQFSKKKRSFTFLVNMFNVYDSIRISLLHSRDASISNIH